MNDIKLGTKVYIDTNIFIYFIEEIAPFYAQALELITHIIDIKAQILTNDITKAECLHRPFRLQDKNLIENYASLFHKN